MEKKQDSCRKSETVLDLKHNKWERRGEETSKHRESFYFFTSMFTT